MKGIPVLDVILTKALPTRCPACGKVDPATDGNQPITRLSCGCGWFARYQLREAANV